MSLDWHPEFIEVGTGFQGKRICDLIGTPSGHRLSGLSPCLKIDDDVTHYRGFRWILPVASRAKKVPTPLDPESPAPTTIRV